MRLVAGAFAAAFALALMVLPLIRVRQRRLPARHAVGLWMAAAGFMLLAFAAFGVLGAAAPATVLGGAVLAIVGNVVQRRLLSRG
ncbi:hypothetical protein BH23GEM10_BH23GEM10_15800 [soil metagenome]